MPNFPLPHYWHPHLVTTTITTQQGIIGTAVGGHQVTIPGDPCPWCRNDQYKMCAGDKVCSHCLLNHSDAAHRRRTRARRDGKGSLLCQACEEPFPYAEADGDGKFKCYGCKSKDRLE